MNKTIERSLGKAWVRSYRMLTPEEVMFVSGGDDPGDGSGVGSDGNGGTGDDGATASVGSSSTAGTLGEVTVSASAEGNGGGSGIGQAQALQMLHNIELAQNPFFAFMLFNATLAQNGSNPSIHGLPPLGNPMGDPNHMFSSPDGSHGDGP